MRQDGVNKDQKKKNQIKKKKQTTAKPGHSQVG